MCVCQRPRELEQWFQISLGKQERHYVLHNNQCPLHNIINLHDERRHRTAEHYQTNIFNRISTNKIFVYLYCHWRLVTVESVHFLHKVGVAQFCTVERVLIVVYLFLRGNVKGNACLCHRVQPADVGIANIKR